MGIIRWITSPLKFGYATISVIASIIFAILVIIGIFVLPILSFFAFISWIIFIAVLTWSWRSFKKGAILTKNLSVSAAHTGIELMEAGTEKGLAITHDITTTGVKKVSESISSGQKYAVFSLGVFVRHVKQPFRDWSLGRKMRLENEKNWRDATKLPSDP